jgi:hypothetical protein
LETRRSAASIGALGDRAHQAAEEISGRRNRDVIPSPAAIEFAYHGGNEAVLKTRRDTSPIGC